MTTFRVLESRDGKRIIAIKKDEKEILIGSKYNQENVIKRFSLSLEPLKSNDIYIIIGLGDGEHIKNLIEKSPSKSEVFILEYNKEIIEYAYNHYEFLRNTRINILSENEEIINLLIKVPSNQVGNIKIGIYANYEVIYREKINKAIKTIKDLINDLAIERNTEIIFAKKWFNTFLENLKNSEKSISLEGFREINKNIPAIIVSAGPSLEKNISLLSQFENAIIFSGGRTLRSLQQYKIKVDYLCVVDAGEVSYDLVKNRLGNTEIPLIYTTTTNKDIVEKYRGEKIVFGNNKTYRKIWGDGIPFLESGGSVAHTMMSAAMYMGCNPIIFVGQDLAYTNDKGHAKIAYNENDKDIEELNEKEIFECYKKENDIFVECINGNKVRTSLVLNSFRLAFERMIIQNKNYKFINATEDGALINGCENMKFKGVIKKYNYEKRLLNKKTERILPKRDIKQVLFEINLHAKEAKEIVKEGV
ncbi:MAG: motility associated factor glycosyltransferase family protein, partial [Sarcina sp.]